MPEGIAQGTWLLAFVTAQRLGELVLARRHTAALLARGGVEHGARHYPLIVALHAVWLIGLWLLAYNHAVDPFWLLLFAILQVARVWVLASLGRRWTTRIIVMPGLPPVARGPYRYMRHPNYVVVACEMAVVPLALGLPVYALVFFLLNLAVLTIRIRAESAALGANSAAKTDTSANLAKPGRTL
jgi:methyltransferase